MLFLLKGIFIISKNCSISFSYTKQPIKSTLFFIYFSFLLLSRIFLSSRFLLTTKSTLSDKRDKSKTVFLYSSPCCLASSSSSFCLNPTSQFFQPPQLHHHTSFHHTTATISVLLLGEFSLLSLLYTN